VHAPALSLVELTWLPKTADRVTALTSQPVACLARGETPEKSTEITLGKLAFNSPALLGGQAEKKGLSCSSCHQNGRGNPHFQFEAISGVPGTADVTSGLFSKVRADNTFNPLPIPDLALPDGQDQVDREDRAALAVFVRGQIEDEFSGDPPPERVFEALLTYLEHIDEAASDCDSAAREPRTWRQDWADARLAADLAISTDNQLEKAFYTRTARTSLRRLHDRYAAPDHAGIRADLILISRDLAAGKNWPENTDELQAQLESTGNTSLYSPKSLSSALTSQE